MDNKHEPDTASALRDAHAKTTQGEWEFVYWNDDDGKAIPQLIYEGDSISFYEAPDNAAFIALAHNTLPALLEHVAAVTRERDALMGFVSNLAAYKGATYESEFHNGLDTAREEISERASSVIAGLLAQHDDD